ncbi:hypothetical protein [Myxococcus landrumensis]|uniref:hypothetical protein n=1 Tax=Myxococcus landrumensis TaxID=2813577 RepID=UPI001F50F492|nr:hypothetical protein [Myxococcus landrumus]
MGLLLGVLLLPLAVRAEVSADVRRYLLSIHRLIDDLAYERALEQIARVKKVSQGPEDDVAVSLYEGVVLSELSKGRQEDAEAAFKSALFLDPDAQLPLKVSPKLKKRFEQVRTKVQKELSSRGEDPKPVVTPVLKPEAKVDVVAPLTPPLPPPAVEKSMRQKAWIPAVAGGALAVGGGVMWLLASKEESKLGKSSPLGSLDEADVVARRTRSMQSVGVGLFVGSAVGLGVAAGMYLLGGPEEPPMLSVGTDGTSAFVSGRWP